ncbi:MAG: hypothetical protein H0X38_01560 [Planctomycetes bacterium]|nr:hypothetical protein [Planctomycetota bacterium]
MNVHIIPAALSAAALVLALAVPLGAEESYHVETISFPPTVVPEIGGLGFTSEGELVVAMRRFGILMAKPTADPAAFPWRAFSSDLLHNICGLQVVSKRELIVSSMDELTRITDGDGDGIADSYQTICSAWGMSGNYHETNTIAPDGSGGWWMAIGTASHNGSVFTNTRGEFSPIGRRGRNFSAVPWKGWIAHIDAKGAFTPWAKGFRAPNGIAVGPDGKLWVTDNQGDWRGASPLFHIQKDHFYGHPSSLVWEPAFAATGQDPLMLPVAEIEAMRTPAAVEFPEGFMCNSPSEPIFDQTGGRFGPFAGQMIVGDVAGTRLLRVMLEEVDGVMQGACVHFVTHGLRAGNNRLIFSPDGATLFTGQTVRGWGAPSESLQRVTFTGTVPFEVKTMSLRKDGFAFTFTKPVDRTAAADPTCWKLSKYHFGNTHNYGSPPLDTMALSAGAIVVAPDGLSATVAVVGLETGRIVQVDLDPRVKSADGATLEHPQLCYKVNRLRP